MVQITHGSTSLIDLALLSTPTLLRSCSVIPPLANSDHFGLLLDIKWKTNTKQARSEKRKIWRYAHADFQRACQLIDSTDWESILCHDVDQSILQWNNCFLNIMEQCIPKAILGRRRNLPWLTKNVSSAIRKRNYLFKRARSSGRRDHVEKYKRMRNRVMTMLRNGKKLFFQNLNPHNNKQFWKAMKYLRKQTSSIPNLSYNNVVSSMDQEKANMLNDYFSKCFNRSQPSLQTTDCLNYPLADDCPDEILCTESEVTELLMTLDIAKASGPDDISARMLRETAEHISPSLTKILIYPSRLDHSLHSGKGQTLFPSQKPMTIVIHLTTGPYLFYLSWANYWRNMFTTLLPSMCPRTHSLPMYSGDSKAGSLP